MDVTQNVAPKKPYNKYTGYDIRPAPATKGATVRTIGTKRAKITILEPYLA